MGKTQLQVTEDQMAYLFGQFLRKPTVDFAEFEANRELCPKCSQKMEVLCIPHNFQTLLNMPKEIQWISSGIFPFSGCQKCKIILLDEEDFLTYSNKKFRFSDLLDNIS